MPTLAFDVADDMDYFDWLSAGTYYKRTSGDTFTEVADVVCLRRVFDRVPKSAGATQLEDQNTTWHIKKNDMDSASIVPAFRDRILGDDGVLWTVLSYSGQTFDSRYRLTCSRVKNPPA